MAKDDKSKKEKKAKKGKRAKIACCPCCKKRCPLTSPKCSKGKKLAKKVL